jgi:hypothetical protein
LTGGRVTDGALDPRSRWFFPAAGLALTVLLVLSEPTRTVGLTTLERSALAALNVMLPLAICLAGSRWLMASTAARLLPYWLWLTLIGAAAALISTPAFVALEAWLGPLDLDDGPQRSDPDLRSFLRSWPSEAWESGRVIVPVWLLLNLAVRWSRPAPIGGEAPAEGRRGFLARLPRRLGDEIISVRAEQHYVQVETTLGGELLFCGFGRAVHELTTQGAPGMAIHRSYWVAWPHVAEIYTVGSEVRCRLKSGQTVPISRRRVREAREAFEAFRSLPARPA